MYFWRLKIFFRKDVAAPRLLAPYAYVLNHPTTLSKQPDINWARFRPYVSKITLKEVKTIQII